jgi:hypothetical protein
MEVKALLQEPADFPARSVRVAVGDAEASSSPLLLASARILELSVRVRRRA